MYMYTLSDASATFASTPGSSSPGWDHAASVSLAPTEAGCDGEVVMATSTGQFSDGNGSYTPYLRCAWALQPPGASALIVEFSDLALERGYDFVLVYEGLNPAGNLIAELTGTKDHDVTVHVSGCCAYIVFEPDGSQQDSGFTAKFASAASDLDALSGEQAADDSLKAAMLESSSGTPVSFQSHHSGSPAEFTSSAFDSDLDALQSEQTADVATRKNVPEASSDTSILFESHKWHITVLGSACALLLLGIVVFLGVRVCTRTKCRCTAPKIGEFQEGTTRGGTNDQIAQFTSVSPSSGHLNDTSSSQQQIYVSRNIQPLLQAPSSDVLSNTGIGVTEPPSSASLWLNVANQQCEVVPLPVEHAPEMQRRPRSVLARKRSRQLVAPLPP